MRKIGWDEERDGKRGELSEASGTAPILEDSELEPRPSSPPSNPPCAPGLPLTRMSPPACHRASRSGLQAPAPPRRLRPRSAAACGWRPPSARPGRGLSGRRRRRRPHRPHRPGGDPTRLPVPGLGSPAPKVSRERLPRPGPRPGQESPPPIPAPVPPAALTHFPGFAHPHRSGEKCLKFGSRSHGHRGFLGRGHRGGRDGVGGRCPEPPGRGRSRRGREQGARVTERPGHREMSGD